MESKFHNIISELDNYKDNSGKFESLFTLLVYNHTVEELLDKLNHQLKKVNNMSGSSLKKKIVNNNLYNSIQYISDIQNNIKNINHVILLDSSLDNNVKMISLNSKQCNILQEYNVRKYNFIYDNTFDIDYLTEIFTNFTFHTIIKLNKHHADIMKINKYKSKLIQSNKCSNISDLVNIVNETKINTGLIMGNSTLLKKNTLPVSLEGWSLENKSLNNEEVLEYFNKKDCLHNQNLMKNTLKDLDNPAKDHLFVFGKISDIQQAIEEYRIKELYTTTDVIKVLKNNIDKDCFNFNTVIVDKLESGDMGDQLKTKYGGAFGISYY